jgi:nucleotide-binding universal stress UspA family protein
MVAVDGSERSLRTARRAVEFAKLTGGSLVAIHVVQLPEYVAEEAQRKMKEELASRADRAFEEARNFATESGVPMEAKFLETTGSIVAAICDAATNDHVDLIVVGTRSSRDVAKIMLGSVAEGVIVNAKCDVLVVR